MCPACPPLSRPAGFTLLEVLITLSVAAILVGLAAPSFKGVLLDSRRTVVVNSFVHSIYLARVTAMTQGRTVSICRSANGDTCDNGTANWQHGWIVFENNDRDDPPMRDANERILSVQSGWREGTATSNRRSYSFRPYHHAVVNGSLVFCDRRGPTQARAVIVSITGRTRIATRDSNDRPLRCPSG